MNLMEGGGALVGMGSGVGGGLERPRFVLSAAVGTGGDAEGLFELAGEGGLVAIAAVEGDVGDGGGGVGEGVAGGVDADFGDVLAGGEVEEGADALVELVDREAGGFGEWFEAERFVDVVADVVENPGESLEVGVGQGGDIEVARDADQADGLSIPIEERFLVGEAPVFAASGVEMAGEVAVDAAGFGDDLHVFLEEGLAEGAGKEVGGTASEQVVTVFNATAGEQRVVGGEVAAQLVLDEKDNVVDMIEEFFGDERGTEALEKVFAEGVRIHWGGEYTNLWSGSGVFHKTAFRRICESWPRKSVCR